MTTRADDCLMAGAGASEGFTMTKITSEDLAARLDVLGVALQEMARALAPAQAAQVAEAIRLRVADVAAESLKPSVDEATAAELSPLMMALQQPWSTSSSPTHPTSPRTSLSL